MADKTNITLDLISINKNEQIRRLRTAGDKLADRATAVAGSTGFLLLNVGWFVAWIVLNTGILGSHLVFDPYPFGFLTMVVSLEAIILAVFVLISQNRQSKRSEIRSELDYLTDLQADAEISTLLTILERLAAKDNVDISDLLHDLSINQRRLLKAHPLTKEKIE